MSRLRDRHIVLGVTGSIAAYKAVEVVRTLVKEGADVRVLMTREASAFVGELTFRALTANSVGTDQFIDSEKTGEEHVDLAVWADAIAIVPATANIIGKIANGLGDDLLTTLMLACDSPCIVAPAMNFRMWKNPAVQNNIELLKSRGINIIEPENGLLANGETGEGRLPDSDSIAEAIAILADPNKDLAGHRILVSAGPTEEDIDPVRYVTNRSSGKMGYAIARSAACRGAIVTLVSGPTDLEDPYGIIVKRIRTAKEMCEVVLKYHDEQDAIIMAAAVVDYSPIIQADQKIKKESTSPLELKMNPTRDILKEISTHKRSILIGFAAETHDGIVYARDKLVDKNLDLIVYNDITTEGAGFDTDTNIVTLIHPDGRDEALPKQPKSVVADRIIDEVVRLFRERSSVS